MMDRAKLEEAIAYYRTKYPGDGHTEWHPAFHIVFAAAEAHLATLPKTKMIAVWRVEWADGNIPHVDDPYLSRDMAERGADKRRAHGPGQCIRVTGPHQQEVPA